MQENGEWPFRTELVRANGHTFEVAMCGTGDKLALCLHGFPEHFISWRHQMPVLAELGFTVWAPNLRGYGRSSRPRAVRDYTPAELLGDVAGLVDAAGKHATMLVGHDMGGGLSWLFALRQIRPLERLIILNVPHPQRLLEKMKNWRQLLRSWYILFFQLPAIPEMILGARKARRIGAAIRDSAANRAAFPDEIIDVYRDNASQPGALTAMLNWYRAFMRQRLTPAERAALQQKITIPTLMIWGERDVALGKELTFGMDQLVTDLTLRYLPDSGHWVQQEAAQEVNAIIREWLAR